VFQPPWVHPAGTSPGSLTSLLGRRGHKEDERSIKRAGGDRVRGAPMAH
jgi:hypothetical protein